MLKVYRAGIAGPVPAFPDQISGPIPTTKSSPVPLDPIRED